MTTFTATYSPDDNKLRLAASARLDADTYARVKAAGFAWAPKQEQFIAPMWTPAREDLCIELAGEISDDDSNLSERAEARAERFDDYQEKRAAESAQALDHVHRIADGIPMGQPILVGHHSERHARKDAERIENGMRRAVQLFDTAEYWKRRAAAAIAHAEYKERPDVRHRRIKGIEADQRKAQKASDETAIFLKLWREVLDDNASSIKRKDGEATTAHGRALFIANRDHVSACFTLDKYPRAAPASQYEGMMSLWSALDGGVCTAEQAQAIALRVHERGQAHRARWLAHYANRLEYERAMLDESGGIVAAQHDLQPGGTITHRGRRSVILKVNRRNGAALSVTVTGQSWTVGIEEITAYEPPSEAAAAAAAAVMKKAPLCNYAGAGFVAITQAQWDEIGTDSKTTRDMGAGVDATQGGARHDLLKDYRAGSEVYTRHRVRVASGWNLRRAIGPDAWAAMVAACSAMTCKDTNTAHSYHPVHITDAKTTTPERVDAPPKAPRKSMARKVAEAAGIDTADAPADAPAPSAAAALTAAKVEARAVLAELTERAPRATHSRPPATQSDTAATIDALRASLKAGVQVVSAPQLFPTPPDLAARMVALAGITPASRVLEPSAGTGRLIDAMMRQLPAVVHAIEINPGLAGQLQARHPAANVHAEDFLAYGVDDMVPFDAVLMNPPFANGADVAHVTHALQFLAPGGRLVAIMSAGVTFRSDRKTAEFRATVERLGGTIEALPAGTFEASGTGVNTVLVVLDAPGAKVEPSPAECEAVPPATQSRSVRMFDVIVTRATAQPIVYPPMEGETALVLMRKLRGRGFECIARTTANGITEDCTADDMEAIYADLVPAAPPATQSAPCEQCARTKEIGFGHVRCMPCGLAATDPPAAVAPQPDWVAEIVHNTLRKRYEWADGRPTAADFARVAQQLEEGAVMLNDQTAANYRAAAAIVRAEPVPPDMVRGGEGNLYPHRLYKCLAVFLEADPDPANAYMERTPGACVLCVRGGRVYIAHHDDKGTEGAALLADEAQSMA